jgi:hypothetical protein
MKENLLDFFGETLSGETMKQVWDIPDPDQDSMLYHCEFCAVPS